MKRIVDFSYFKEIRIKETIGSGNLKDQVGFQAVIRLLQKTENLVNIPELGFLFVYNRGYNMRTRYLIFQNSDSIPEPNI